jgi:hypothetical protein
MIALASDKKPGNGRIEERNRINSEENSLLSNNISEKWERG